QSFSAACSSAGASPGRFSTLKPADRSGPSPLSLTSSATKIFAVIMARYISHKRHKRVSHKKAHKRKSEKTYKARQLLKYILCLLCFIVAKEFLWRFSFIDPAHRRLSKAKLQKTCPNC